MTSTLAPDVSDPQAEHVPSLAARSGSASDVHVCLVGVQFGNCFMNELLDALRYELSAAGIGTSFAWSGFPTDDPQAVFVCIPHEFFGCVDPAAYPTEQQLRQTIALSVEQPGSPWFELGAARAATCAITLDINRTGVAELRRRGVAAEHFRIGYTPYWDRWHGNAASERPTDVVFLGTANTRRARLLSGYARTLWRYDAHLLLAPQSPKPTARLDFPTGEAKWELLASSKILLNLHRHDTPCLDWVRVVEAVSNGCVVVSEHSTDIRPFEPSTHIVAGAPTELAVLADELLSDGDRLEELRSSAYDVVRTELPMHPSVGRLVEIAQHLRTSPGPGRRRTSAVRSETLARFTYRRVRASARARLTDLTAREKGAHDREELQRLSAAVKQLALNDIELRRLMSATDTRLQGLDPDALSVVYESASYRDARPRVSVTVPLYNHVEHVMRAIRSAAASDYPLLEILVIDDGSTDGGAALTKPFLEEWPDVPVLVQRRLVNRGPGRTRNELVAHARGEYVFVLDADNEVYPTAISKLVDALDRVPDAFFSYSMLEEHEHDVPVGLRSLFPWDPVRLAAGNYIDAMALVRRHALVELGGFTEDLRFYGWEDYDLWCRCADRGGYGVHVPQILGRYKVAARSMLSVTAIDIAEVRSLLRQRYPGLWRAASPDETPALV